MKICKVEIRNFRSIRQLSFEPGNLSTFIGKNSNGKSNILKSIEFFFKATAKADPSLRCSFADEESTWVECTFNQLTRDEADELQKYVLSDGSVCFRRTLYNDGNSAKTTVCGYVEEPANEWLRVGFENYSDHAFWQKQGIEFFDYVKADGGRITRAMHEEFISSYMRRHQGEIAYRRSLSHTEARGRQSTLFSILPQLTFVPAVGDIIGEVYGKRSSLLNQMIGDILKGAREHQIYQTADQRLADAQGFVNPSPHRLPLLGRIEQELERKLQAWPGTKCTIRTDLGELSDLLISGLILHINDGTDSDMASKGDGIQRQILFQAFRLYADYKRKRGIFADEELNAEGAAGRHASSIIVFEEPELFLHPQAQEQFYDDLVDVSATDQVLLATHSNHLVRLEFADRLYIVRRHGRGEPTLLAGPSQRWADPEDIQIIKEIDSFNSEIAKIFFADRIVLTEGPEDVVYLLATAKSSGIYSRAVSVVACGGIGSIPRIQRILNSLQIPYCVGHDADPGNPATTRHAARIAALAAEAQEAGVLCEVHAFHPTLPHEFYGGTLPDGADKVEKALVAVRQTAADDAFVAKVRRLFGINPTNPPPSAAPAHTPQ
jgi:putative ATP-dependent endonuclease of OLD family